MPPSSRPFDERTSPRKAQGRGSPSVATSTVVAAPHRGPLDRTAIASAPPEAVVRCQLSVRLPRRHWLRDLSERHPTIRFEVLDRLPVDARTMMFDVRHASKRDLVPELRRRASIVSVESHGIEAEGQRLRVFARGPTLVPLHQRLRLARQLPFSVRRGTATWTVIGPAARVRRLLEHLSRRALDPRIVSLRRGPAPPYRATLTSRQRELFRRAWTAGYYEVPRRVSLSELARRSGVATSTLSVTLARAERRLLLQAKP